VPYINVRPQHCASTFGASFPSEQALICSRSNVFWAKIVSPHPFANQPPPRPQLLQVQLVPGLKMDSCPPRDRFRFTPSSLSLLAARVDSLDRSVRYSCATSFTHRTHKRRVTRHRRTPLCRRAPVSFSVFNRHVKFTATPKFFVNRRSPCSSTKTRRKTPAPFLNSAVPPSLTRRVLSPCRNFFRLLRSFSPASNQSFTMVSIRSPLGTWTSSLSQPRRLIWVVTMNGLLFQLHTPSPSRNSVSGVNPLRLEK